MIINDFYIFTVVVCIELIYENLNPFTLS